MSWSASPELGRIDRGGALAIGLSRATRAAAWSGVAAYQVRGFAFDDELLLLQVLWGRQTCQYALPEEKAVWLVQCQHVVEVGTC